MSDKTKLYGIQRQKSVKLGILPCFFTCRIKFLESLLIETLKGKPAAAPPLPIGVRAEWVTPARLVVDTPSLLQLLFYPESVS